jgi:serine/threonine protein kinase
VQAGTRLGPYEVVALLGAGGMGEVWRARDTRLGRDVALKVVHPRLASDPDRLSRFEKEARAAAQLDHPNILVVHDVGTHEGSPFIVSELLQGESLREKLGAPLPPKKAVDYTIQIAHGLAAAHEKGIVHRDIKPENVFVTKDGHVKILDFGVAKLLPSFEASGVNTETPTASATQPGTAVGTIAYMSPEQIRGQPVDARSDLFSLGVVLYEMLSGKRPFQRETPADTMSAILREEPPDLSETNRSVPAALENVVRHCLEKEPERRFQSARDVVFAIEALPDVSSARPAAPMSPAGVWLHRHRKALAGAALAVVLAGIGALIVSRRQTAGSKNAPTILALPCKVYGAPEAEYLTDAVPGTISTLLSQVEGLDTKVPPSSFEVEKVKGDLKRLADLYQVSSFIVTSITTTSGRFALNVQLVDAATRKVRWGKQYEGPREAYNDLARQAAEGVRLAVRPAALAVPTAAVSSEAELALREGEYFTNRYLNLHRPQDFERRSLSRDHRRGGRIHVRPQARKRGRGERGQEGVGSLGPPGPRDRPPLRPGVGPAQCDGVARKEARPRPPGRVRAQGGLVLAKRRLQPPDRLGRRGEGLPFPAARRRPSGPERRSVLSPRQRQRGIRSELLGAAG